MPSAEIAKIQARLLATAAVARAVAMVLREFSECTEDHVFVDDHHLNLLRLGLSDIDSAYVLATAAGNPVEKLVEEVVSPCFVGLRPCPRNTGDLPTPPAEILRLWAGCGLNSIKPSDRAQTFERHGRRPPKSAFDRKMPAKAFQAIVAAFADIAFAPPTLIEERKKLHYSALRTVLAANEAKFFVAAAEARSVTATAALRERLLREQPRPRTGNGQASKRTWLQNGTRYQLFQPVGPGSRR